MPLRLVPYAAAWNGPEVRHGWLRRTADVKPSHGNALCDGSTAIHLHTVSRTILFARLKELVTGAAVALHFETAVGNEWPVPPAEKAHVPGRKMEVAIGIDVLKQTPSDRRNYP